MPLSTAFVETSSEAFLIETASTVTTPRTTLAVVLLTAESSILGVSGSQTWYNFGGYEISTEIRIYRPVSTSLSTTSFSSLSSIADISTSSSSTLVTTRPTTTTTGLGVRTTSYAPSSTLTPTHHRSGHKLALEIALPILVFIVFMALALLLFHRRLQHRTGSPNTDNVNEKALSQSSDTNQQPVVDPAPIPPWLVELPVVREATELPECIRIGVQGPESNDK